MPDNSPMDQITKEAIMLGKEMLTKNVIMSNRAVIVDIEIHDSAGRVEPTISQCHYELVANKSYKFKVSVKNTSKSIDTWTTDDYYLTYKPGLFDFAGMISSDWKVPVDKPISPGSTATFEFDLTTPNYFKESINVGFTMTKLTELVKGSKVNPVHFLLGAVGPSDTKSQLLISLEKPLKCADDEEIIGIKCYKKCPQSEERLGDNKCYPKCKAGEYREGTLCISLSRQWPPPSPSMHFKFFKNTNDKVLISLAKGLGNVIKDVSGPDQVFYDTWKKLKEANKKQDPDSVKNLADNEMHFVSSIEKDKHFWQKEIKAFHYYRLEKEPEVIEDFFNHSNFVSPENPHVTDSIEPNKKYYYTAVAKGEKEYTSDPEGYVTSPFSPVYVVEIIDEGGTIVPTLKEYSFKKKITRKTIINLKKTLRIAPSFIQGAPNKKKNDLGFESTSTFVGDSTTIPTFKIRVTSNKTKRKIDLNIRFRKSLLGTKPKDAELLLEYVPVKNTVAGKNKGATCETTSGEQGGEWHQDPKGDWVCVKCGELQVVGSDLKCIQKTAEGSKCKKSTDCWNPDPSVYDSYCGADSICHIVAKGTDVYTKEEQIAILANQKIGEECVEDQNCAQPCSGDYKAICYKKKCTAQDDLAGMLSETDKKVNAICDKGCKGMPDGQNKVGIWDPTAGKTGTGACVCKEKEPAPLPDPPDLFKCDSHNQCVKGYMCQPDWYYYKEQKVWKKVNACVKGETFCSKGTTTDSGGPENQLAHDRCTAYGECGYDDENKKCIATAEGCAQSKYCSEVDKFGVLKAACCPNKETGKCSPASSTSGIGKNFEFTCPPSTTAEEFTSGPPGKCNNDCESHPDMMCSDGLCVEKLVSSDTVSGGTTAAGTQQDFGFGPIADLPYDRLDYMINRLHRVAKGLKKTSKIYNYMIGTKVEIEEYHAMTKEQKDAIFAWKSCQIGGNKVGNVVPSAAEIKKCRAKLMPKLLTKCKSYLNDADSFALHFASRHDDRSYWINASDSSNTTYGTKEQLRMTWKNSVTNFYENEGKIEFPIQMLYECDVNLGNKSPGCYKKSGNDDLAQKAEDVYHHLLNAPWQTGKSPPDSGGCLGFWNKPEFIQAWKDYKKIFEAESVKYVKCSPSIYDAWCHPDDPKIKEYEDAKNAG